jgi:hypothetical protein
MKTLIFKIAFVAFILSSCNIGKHYANYRAGGKTNKEMESNTEQKATPVSESSYNFPDITKLEVQILTDTFFLAVKETESNDGMSIETDNRNGLSLTKKSNSPENGKPLDLAKKNFKSGLKNKKELRAIKSKKPFKQMVKKSSKSDFWEIAEGVGSVLLLAGLLIYAIFFAGLGIIDIIALLLTLGLAILIFWGLWKLFSGFLFMFDN